MRERTLIIILLSRIKSCESMIFAFQLFKSLRVQLEMRRKQVEGALQSTQRDGMLTVDQALVKQAWERISKRVRAAGLTTRLLFRIVHRAFFFPFRKSDI